MHLNKSGFVLLAAALLGISGEMLLRSGMGGLAGTIWIAALVAAAVLVLRHSGADPAITAPPALFFAACLTLRDSEALAAWNAVAVLVTLMLPVIQRDGVRLGAASVSRYLRGYGRALRGTLFGVFPLVVREIRWETVFNRSWQRRAGAIGVGLALTLPVVAVFSALFSSADPAFARGIEGLFDWDIERFVEHGIVTAVWAGLAAGYLRGIRGRSRPLPEPTAGPQLSALIISIPLVALACLFAAFGALQLTYLFGGAEVIRETTGLTYAQWARRGFFELVIASALVVPVLLLAVGRVRSANPRGLRLVRWLAGLLIGLVATVMGSAIYRMALYVDAYGLSQDRLYATVFMGWVGIVLAWFAATTLRGRGDRFAVGALISGLGVLALLNVSNPAAWVVRTNVTRVEHGSDFDVRYHAYRLGEDAVPTLLESWPRLPQEVRCEAMAYLVSRHGQARSQGWRTWNLARWRAARAWRRHEKQLEGKPCFEQMYRRIFDTPPAARLTPWMVQQS